MQNTLFRKKSLERVSSPEQLNDYMRVTNPAIWMVLGAVIALLAGLIVLASINKLETTLNVQATVENGVVTITVPASEAQALDEGMPLRIAGQEISVECVYQDESGKTICLSSLNSPDGLYDAEIVTDSITPIRFLLN